MTLTSFIKKNKAQEKAGKIIVSHPSKGFRCVDKSALNLWTGWGWSKETWKVAPKKPVAVKKAVLPPDVEK